MVIFLNEILSPMLGFHMILFELKLKVHYFQLLSFWTSLNQSLKSNGPPMRLCERKSKFDTHDPFS